MAFCVGRYEGPIKAGCSITLPPDMGARCEPEGRYRCMYRCYTPPVQGVWQPQVHRACAHNFVSGLLQRTLGPTPSAEREGEAMLAASFKELARVVVGRVNPIEPWDLERVVSSYRERRMRVRYQEALASLRDEGLSTRRDSRVKAFVKGEKLARYKVDRPRVIMGRSPRYNLELASYLKPIEHEVYGALRGWGRRFYTHTRLIGKGLDLKQRAALLRRKFFSVPDLVAFEIDGKSFESHCAEHVLRREHEFYLRLLPDARLRTLLRWQLEFDGRGPDGVRFHARGVRASGDFNTGLGNTLIMCCLVLAVARAIGSRFDFLADGDNAVVFVSKRDLELWRLRLPLLSLRMGFTMELGEPTSNFEEVVFGQSKPCLTGGGWTMVRDPWKVLSHACCSHEHYAEMRGGLRVLKAVAYCEAVLNKGVPVLQAFAAALLKALRGVHMAPHVRLDTLEYQRTLAQGVRWELAKQEMISQRTRLLFAKSWGISVEEQLRLEDLFAQGVVFPTSWDGVPAEEWLGGKHDPWDVPFTLHGAWHIEDHHLG